MSELADEHDLGLLKAKSNVKQLLNEFLESRRQGTSPHTILFYKRCLTPFLLVYPLTSDGIAKFLSSLSCGNGKFAYFRAIRAFINWLIRNDYFKDNPLDSRVKLRRKAPETTSTSRLSGRPQTTIRPGRAIASTRRFPTSVARRAVQPGQEILLKVRERYYKDENLEVDFYIDSADEEKLVYWEPGKPGKYYELKRVASPIHLAIS